MSDAGGKDPCPNCGEALYFTNDPPALQPRTILIEKYLIGKCLGRGGFGITYLAYDLSLESRVAIKEYLPKQIASRNFDKTTVQPNTKDNIEDYEYGLDRFLKEARMLRKFNNPSIIKVHSCFKENNTAYFDMPFIPGKTLEQYVIGQGRISEQELTIIMNPIFEGLKAVHEKKIYHRDIKPANIYIPDDGLSLLLDFGSARQEMANKNQSFSVFLTHGYAPFEQYSTQKTQGPYTDVYACSATMYSCLRGKIGEKIKTGKPNIVPPTSAIDIYNEKTSHPHIKKESSQPISDGLADAIMKGLEFYAENRIQSISEFQEMLPNPYEVTSHKYFHTDYDLLCLAGEFEGERFPLLSKPLIIGRNPKHAAIVINNKTISSTHCQIHAVDGFAYIKDIKSKNGTYINDVARLKPLETRRLGLGDTISLAGSVVFQVVKREMPEPVKELVKKTEKEYTVFWESLGRVSLFIVVVISILLTIIMVWNWSNS
ncbi:MAG: FHA domain-containing protein [Desulfobacterales bacterium]|nr:FHA domain-containing protein [Desulfobacterales bacterium]